MAASARNLPPCGRDLSATSCGLLPAQAPHAPASPEIRPDDKARAA
ncbi:hypothetical protein LHK_03040 [Laribacter hongkongensis HLHK9]|uniref:Uncharacterized protein n=1 Tax=Laribacter hongkongensis (strain HLHK9) TaxID=557598 RepID=C1D5K1_LARHH|nr:hypothetical protein LHK_03040 [Laribacter hongkongensis HLHK9]